MSPSGQRLNRKGLRHTASPVSFTFDGRLIDAYTGESVAAALAASGITALRRHGATGGEWRGIYCGMGACFDCVVTIDGRAGQRACLAKIKGGEVIRSDAPRGTAAEPLQPLAALPQGKALEERPIDVLVVGAGPAGLAAALAAARAGASVVVLDERIQSGGQYFKPIAEGYHAEKPIDQQFKRGQTLTLSAIEAGVELIPEATVWGAIAADEVLALVAGQAVVYRPKKLILATGAYERAVPFPGWTLPGVMTTGALQTLVRAEQVVPGERIVIAGNGPLNFQLADDLADHGADVVALGESAARPGLSQANALVRAWATDPSNMRKGLGYMSRLKRRGVPLLWQHKVVAATGDHRIQSVTLEGPNNRVELPCDTLALGYGFVASIELAAALGCKLERDQRHVGTWRVATDENGETGIHGVFAVGDGAKVAGAEIALSAGDIAGKAAAKQLGLDADTTQSRTRLARASQFQQALWTLFEAPDDDIQTIPDKTLLCRCESLSFGEVRAVISGGAASLGVLKRRLRLGMGRCQGRYCVASASDLLEAQRPDLPQTDAAFAPRLPVKPFPAAALMLEKPEWGGHSRARSPNLARNQAGQSFGRIDAGVAIIGAGVVGACLAFELASDGHDVVVIERDDVNLQASGANAGSLHVQLLSFDFGDKAEAGGGPAAETLPLGPYAVGLWQELARACEGAFEIRITGGLMVAESEAGMNFLRAKAALEKRYGLEAEILGANELRNLSPALAHDLIGAEWSPMEGKINPLAATYAVMAKAQELGGRLLTNTNINTIERDGGGWKLGTNRGHVHCGRMINAAGPWAREVGAMAGLDLPVYSAPLQMIVTERAPPMVDQLVAHADRHLSLKQLASGGIVIGGAWTAHYSEAQNLNVTLRESIEGNLWVAGRVLPQLSGLHVLRSWAGMNVNIDGAPIVGEAPGAPGFFNAVTSNGYTLAPAVARLTRDIIAGRDAGFDITPFRLERFG